VVADASVLVKWVIPEDYSDHAVMLRDDHLEGRVRVHAPDLALLEAASALRKHVLRGTIAGEQAMKALRLLGEAELVLEPTWPELALETLELSLELDVTPYDAAYLALAKRLDAPFYTADERLLSAPRAPEPRGHSAPHPRIHAAGTSGGGLR
jgi:predicted nucleic acid-binding protein